MMRTPSASDKPEPTPRPWVSAGKHHACDDQESVWSGDAIVAICPDDHHGQAKANAAHIVRCVNVHDELVQALEQAIALIEAIPLTVRQVVEHDTLRELSGINPYCMNEGLATGDEAYSLTPTLLYNVLAKAKGE